MPDTQVIKRVIRTVTDKLVEAIVLHHPSVAHPKQDKTAIKKKPVLNHLYWMCEEIYKMDDFSKQSRWIGFIQGAMWSMGIVTIDHMRLVNREAEKDRGAVDFDPNESRQAKHNIRAETILRIQEHTNEFDGYKITTSAQVIDIGIDNNQSCCESWGYFSSEDDIHEFEGAKLLEIAVTDTALNTTAMDHVGKVELYDGDIMFVNITTTKGVLQFAVYNEHNGYYGHSAFVKATQYKFETYL